MIHALLCCCHWYYYCCHWCVNTVLVSYLKQVIRSISGYKLKKKKKMSFLSTFTQNLPLTINLTLLKQQSVFFFISKLLCMLCLPVALITKKKSLRTILINNEKKHIIFTIFRTQKNEMTLFCIVHSVCIKFIVTSVSFILFYLM